MNFVIKDTRCSNRKIAVQIEFNLQEKASHILHELRASTQKIRDIPTLLVNCPASERETRDKLLSMHRKAIADTSFMSELITQILEDAIKSE